MKLFSTFILFIYLLIIGGYSSASAKWRTEGPPNQTVQVKDIESTGADFNYQNINIGVSKPVIASFTSIGLTERKALLKTLPAPSLRLTGSHLTYLTPEIDTAIQAALNGNADPVSMDNTIWLNIKAKYPTITHFAITVFEVHEEWKISQEAHHLPYIWSSSIVAKTMIIDLNTRTVVSEWRQEVADRSTWTDACSSPEELARYLVSVQSAK